VEVDIGNRTNCRSSALGSVRALGAGAALPAPDCFGAAALGAVIACCL